MYIWHIPTQKKRNGWFHRIKKTLKYRITFSCSKFNDAMTFCYKTNALGNINTYVEEF